MDLKNTLRNAKFIHKASCKHSGGIIDPDECIMNFVNKRNEEKIFVGTNDEDLRNELRNLGTVPIFFFKAQVLIMDTPSGEFDEKMKYKEMMKLEPTIQEKKLLKSQSVLIERIRQEELIKEKIKYRESIKDLYCMGIKTKLAAGPNPLSMRKKVIKPMSVKIKKEKKRRLRKGKRSK